MFKRGKKGIWYISVGGVSQTSGTTNREQAKRVEQRLNIEAIDLKHGFALPTWDQGCAKWFKAHPKESYRDNLIEKFWTPFLTGKKLYQIESDLIHEIITRERPGVTVESRTKPNATANAYVAFVAKIIRYAKLQPKLIFYPTNKGNERWVSPEDWLAIASHLTDNERDVLTFSLATGLREKNVMDYQWSWVHGTWGTVPSPDVKTDVPIGVPFNRTTQEVLERRRRAVVKNLTLVFTDDEGKPWYKNKLLRALRRACKAAGVPVLTVHALRHTFGSWLARGKAPRDVRKRLMAHTSGDVHDVYIHWDVESLRSYSEAIDAALRGVSTAKIAARSE